MEVGALEDGRSRRGTRKQCMFCFASYPKEEVVCPYCGHEEGSGKRKSFYLDIGTELHQGRYIIGEAVRNGGFGILYRAFDTKLQTLIAIKEYFPSELVNRQRGEVRVSLNYDDEYYQLEYHRGIRDFIMEARIMLKFPNDESVCNTYTYFEENGTAYIVMEFIDGISLREYIKQNGAKNIPEETSLRFMRQILEGLDTIHRAKVIHKDIAPDNILVLRDGSIKIIDFGASCVIGKKRLKDEVIFKPGFAPPEQYEEFTEIGPWLDIYATGATFYYLLTGKVPPESPGRDRDDTIIPPMELNPSVSKEINAAVLRALSPRIENRIQSAEDFMKQLNGIRVQTPKEMEVHSKVRKAAAWIAAVVVLFVLVIEGVIFYNKGREKDNNRLIVWIGVSEEQAAAEAEEARYRKIFDEFSRKNQKVQIDLVTVPEKSISDKFNSTSKGSRPDLLEVTFATEDVKEDLIYLSYLRDVFPGQTGALKAAALTGFKGYPMSRVVRLRFVTTDEEDTTGTTKQFESVLAYINGTGNRYLESDSSVYLTLHKNFEGNYSLEKTEDETAYYTDFYGVNKQSRNPELAQELLKFMADVQAQAMLHVEGDSGLLPVDAQALELLVKDNPELTFLLEELEGDNVMVKDSQMQLFSDRGVRIVSVPDLLGKTEEEAVKELKGLGISSMVEWLYQAEVPKGEVFWQGVQEGKRVFTGSSIKLRISNGRLGGDALTSTPAPTKKPTKAPTKAPTNTPAAATATPAPTNTPTPEPTKAPTSTPTPTPVVILTYREVVNATVGQIVTMGTYQQEASKEEESPKPAVPVEWIVAAKKDGRALLVSRYVLEIQEFGDETNGADWKNSYLRSWLNGTFYETAFSAAERKKIQNTTCENDYGGTTTDRVFILSMAEARRYLTESLLRTRMTPYAKAVALTGGEYWLRTAGTEKDCAATVTDKGVISEEGGKVFMQIYGVRPAIWISEK